MSWINPTPIRPRDSILRIKSRKMVEPFGSNSPADFNLMMRGQYPSKSRKLRQVSRVVLAWELLIFNGFLGKSSDRCLDKNLNIYAQDKQRAGAIRGHCRRRVQSAPGRDGAGHRFAASSSH